MAETFFAVAFLTFFTTIRHFAEQKWNDEKKA